MTDNLNNRGPQDALRINVNEPWELKYWCKEFGVSAEHLKTVVKEVGVMAADVRRALAK